MDLIVYDLSHGRPILVHGPASATVYSSSQVNIELVMVGGVLTMECKRMTTIDEKEILYATQKAAEKLINEVGLGNTQWGRKTGNLGL